MTTIPTDKRIHFLGGVFVSLAVGAFLGPRWGFAASVAVGIGKEVWDASHPGNTCDLWDAVATIGGGAVGSGLLMLL